MIVTFQEMIEFAKDKEISHEEQYRTYRVVVFSDGSAIMIETSYPHKDIPRCYILRNYVRDIMNKILVKEQNKQVKGIYD